MAPLVPGDEDDITHDYHEGCIYDMCGDKKEIIYSCVTPIICTACENFLRKSGITTEIEYAIVEMRQLKRTRYYGFVHFLKKNPWYSFIASCFLAFIMGTMANCATGCSGILRVIVWGMWFAVIIVIIGKSLITRKIINFKSNVYEKQV